MRSSRAASGDADVAEFVVLLACRLGPIPLAALSAADQLFGRVLHVGDDLNRLSERCHKDADLRRLWLNLD